MLTAKCPRARQGGFTLIEGIITIVILGIVMVTLTSFLFPQAERSATPHYQARAAAIGNAFLNEILSRKFDEHSDPLNDSLLRCGENGAQSCTAPNGQGRWPEDDPEEYFDYVDPVSGNLLSKGLVVSVANDVDDFHGCWGTLSLCADRYPVSQVPWRGFIENLLEGNGGKNSAYFNMTVRVNVYYRPCLEVACGHDILPNQHKRIDVQVDTGRYGKYDFVAYRSNY